MTGDWLTLSDVARVLGARSREVFVLINEGELVAEWCPGGFCVYHISEASLEEYIAARLPVVAT